MSTHEINDGEKEWIEWVEIDEIPMGDVSFQDLESKGFVFLRIHSQTMKDRGGYNLIQIK